MISNLMTCSSWDEVRVCPLLFLGYMLDLLRTQGRNGAVALLEGLMIHYPILYTQVTGRKPSTEPSRFSGRCLLGFSCSFCFFFLSLPV